MVSDQEKTMRSLVAKAKEFVKRRDFRALETTKRDYENFLRGHENERARLVEKIEYEQKRTEHIVNEMKEAIANYNREIMLDNEVIKFYGQYLEKIAAFNKKQEEEVNTAPKTEEIKTEEAKPPETPQTQEAAP